MADKDLASILSQHDAWQIHLSGMILSVLVERNVLTSGEARALIEDMIAKMPNDLPLHKALAALLAEFPG